MSSGDLPNTGIEPALAGYSLPLCHLGSPSLSLPDVSPDGVPILPKGNLSHLCLVAQSCPTL